MQLPTPTVLSIFSFEDRTLKPELAWLRTGLVDMLIGELAGRPSLVVVQRERVDEIIREQALQVSGRVSDHSMVKIGRLIGANVVLTGRLTVVDNLLLIHAQFVSLEHGAVLGAVAAEGPLKDATNVARRLVEKVRTLLLNSQADFAPWSATDGQPNESMDFRREPLPREDKLFEALRESEHGQALNQSPTALLDVKQSYSFPSEGLQGATASSSLQNIERLIERIATGLEADLGTPFYDEINQGGMLTVPVSIRFSSTVEEVLDTGEDMPGMMSRTGEHHDTHFVMPGDEKDSSWPEATFMRRFYLRLLAQDGRTIALYSDFKKWRLANWIARDGAMIHVRRGHILKGEAKFASLTAEQSAAVSSLKMTLDRVPHERATVRIDVQTISDQKPPSGDDTPTLDMLRSRRTGLIKQEAAFSRSIAPLRALIEEVWSPPIYERPWIRGYLPSNERMSVITCVLDPLRRQIIEGPRLVRLSGEEDFDYAALSALNAVLLPWLSSHGFDSLRQSNITASHRNERSIDTSSFVKLRVQFDLRKDVPTLNLFGSKSFDSTIQPPSYPQTGRK